MGRGRGEMTAPRASVAAVEADHGGDAELVAGCGRCLQVLGQDLHLGSHPRKIALKIPGHLPPKVTL
jgi:hypothetical protein